MVKSPFAMCDNKVVHISELVDSNYRKNNEFFCCSCNDKLTPRLGKHNKWHFSHKKSNCSKALETGLHLFAKNVLEDSKKITLPELCVFNFSYYEGRKDFSYDVAAKYNKNDTILLHDDKGHHYYESIGDYDDKAIICKEREYYFESVMIEQRCGDIIPDIILYLNNKPLLVEVFVTHKVDEIKLSKIKLSRLSTIEIDLSKYKDNFLNVDVVELKRIIIEQTDNKIWLYNDKAENKILDYINKNEDERKNDCLRTQQLVDKRMELMAKSNREKLNIIKNEDSLKKKYKIDMYKSEMWFKLAKDLFIDISCIPEIIDFDIKGDIVFACHKNIWQAAIYHKFIRNNKNRYLSIRTIAKWILNESRIPINNCFIYSSFGIEETSYLERIVKVYLSNLSRKGIVRFEINRYIVAI